MMVKRKPSSDNSDKKSGEINATAAQLVYYGIYTAVFGKMAVVVLERVVNSLAGG